MALPRAQTHPGKRLGLTKSQTVFRLEFAKEKNSTEERGQGLCFCAFPKACVCVWGWGWCVCVFPATRPQLVALTTLLDSRRSTPLSLSDRVFVRRGCCHCGCRESCRFLGPLGFLWATLTLDGQLNPIDARRWGHLLALNSHGNPTNDSQ